MDRQVYTRHRIPRLGLPRRSSEREALRDGWYGRSRVHRLAGYLGWNLDGSGVSEHFNWVVFRRWSSEHGPAGRLAGQRDELHPRAGFGWRLLVPAVR